MANLVCIEDIIKVVGMKNYINSLNLLDYQLKYIGYLIDDENRAVLNFKYVDDGVTTLQKLAISKNRAVTYIHCSCHNFDEKEYCPHIALALKFLFQQKTMIDEIIDGLKTEQDSTFNQYLFKQFSSSKETLEKVNLEVILKKEYSYYHSNYIYVLQLKLGTDKMYSLNSNLFYFLQEYQEKGFEWEFGKYFTYQSDKHYFNKKDQNILQFLKAYYDSKNQYSEMNNNKIILSDNLLKQFLPLLKDHKFSIQNQLFTQTYQKIRTDFKLESELKEVDERVELFIPRVEIEPITSDYQYIKYRNEIYELDYESAKLLEIIINHNKQEIIFKKEELESFANLILPVMKKLDQGIKVDEKVKERFIDTTLTPKIYIDAKDDVIQAKVMLVYEEQEMNLLSTDTKIGEHFITRNQKQESIVKNRLIDYGFHINMKNKLFELTNIDFVVPFLEYGIASLCKDYQVFISKEVKNKQIISTPFIKSSFAIGKDNILSYQFHCDYISKEEMYQLLKNYKENKKYYPLKDGNILSLKDSSLDTFTHLVDSFSLSKEEIESGEVNISTYQLAKVDDELDKEYVEYDLSVQHLLDQFHNYKNLPIDIDADSKKILRDYQLDGVKFLSMLANCGFGGILADEMGLGKSLQTITYIKTILQEKEDAKFLIVVPTSLIYNWENEIKKFAPTLKYLIINDNKEIRKRKIENLENINVLITTYGLLRQDIELYETIRFHTCIIDEAQAIKNMASQNAKAVKRVTALAKFALTGTPIENSILELWSIFDFIMPGFLKSSKSFKEMYHPKQIEEHPQLLEKLNKQISPFILRRKKTDVLKDLPDKIENTIYVDLTEEQKRLYISWLETTKEEINQAVKKDGFEKNQILILSLLTKLRQICIEPRLIMERYEGKNAKLIALMDILKQVIENGHKVLLFSQFPSALQYVKESLEQEQITYYYLDGQTNSKRRIELVEKFNHDDTNVFLISLKAGGTGLNLTSADIVIHLDPWWNPQVENQATDRTHRIGQKKVVEVLKLITKGTIEEKILDLQEKKKKLSEQVIEGKERSQVVLSKLTEQELKSLLELS